MLKKCFLFYCYLAIEKFTGSEDTTNWNKIIDNGVPYKVLSFEHGLLVTTSENTAIDITLSASDADQDPLTYTIVSQPAQGVLSGAAPNITYTPNANWSGTDSFSYKVNDGLVDSNTVTVSIKVNTVNDAPTISTVAKTDNEDASLTFAATDFTSQFTDADGDSLSLVKITSLPANGTLALNGTAVTLNQEIAVADLGNLTFTPDANWNGTTSFTWNGSDGTDYASSGATVNITVNAVNDAAMTHDML